MAQTYYFYCAAHPHVRALLKLFGKHFPTVCPCNLYNRPSSAFPISQAWNVVRTTEARIQQRQIVLYPLTCQHRRQMNSPSIINGIKEHLQWQPIAQSSSANRRQIKTGQCRYSSRRQLCGKNNPCVLTFSDDISLCEGCRSMRCFDSFGYHGCRSDRGLTSLDWLKTVPFKNQSEESCRGRLQVLINKRHLYINHNLQWPVNVISFRPLSSACI